MKLIKTLMIVFILCANTIVAFSQSICDPALIIRTNPNDSYNDQKPNKRIGENIPFCNFDWTQENFWYIANPPSTENVIRSPFYQSNNSVINHFLDNKDMKPEDGWELIKQEFGRTVQFHFNRSPHTIQEPRPVLILYNRYTGILRIFISMEINKNFNASEISLQFQTESKSSILDMSLSNSTAPMLPLDAFGTSQNSALPNPVFTSICRYLDGDHQWFYAEFPMSYDPCTCLFSSKLLIKVYLIEKAELYAEGTSNGKIFDADLENKTNTNNTEGSSFSIGAEFKLDNYKKAYESYKSMEEMKNKTKERIEKYEESLMYGPPVPDEILKRNAKTIDALSDFEQSIRSDVVVRAGFEAIPYLSAAFSFFDFFIGGGKSNSGPQYVKIMPMCVQMTSQYKGTITSRQDKREITFWTPGCDIPNLLSTDVDDEYPYYNLPLGVFCLLETPKLQIYSFKKETSTPLSDNIPPYNDFTVEHLMQMKFQDDDLKYSINPSSGLDINSAEIMASIEVDFDSLSNLTLNEIASTINCNFFQRSSMYSYETSFIPLECLKDIPFTHYKFERSTQRFGNGFQIVEAPFLPIKIYLKLLVNMKRIDGQGQNVVFFGKYPVNPIEVNNSISGSWNWNSIWRSIPIDDITITDAQITNNKTLGRISLIGAHHTGGSSICKSGTEIILRQSGNSDVIIKSDLILQMGMPIECNNQRFLPVQHESINAFCQSNQYRIPRGINNRRLSGEPSKGTNAILGCYLYPNITDSEVVLNLRTIGEMTVDVNIVDILGVVVKEVKKGYDCCKGNNDIRFDVSSLNSGLYFVNIKTETGTHTEKLTVVK